jgi:hypothetical protein
MFVLLDEAIGQVDSAMHKFQDLRNNVIKVVSVLSGCTPVNKNIKESMISIAIVLRLSTYSFVTHARPLWSEKMRFNKLFLKADPRIGDISWTPHVVDYNIEWVSYLMESKMAELYYVCNKA